LNGSQNNDSLTIKNNKVVTITNNAGGILEVFLVACRLSLRVAIKPTPSITRAQETIDLRGMKGTGLVMKGRHDVCIVPRAVVVVEAMLAVTLCDFARRAALIPGVVE